MQRVCQKFHDKKLPKEPVVVFCMNIGCLNRFACSQCVQEFHSDHQDKLFPIADINTFIKDIVSQIKQNEKYSLVEEINQLRAELISSIETHFRYKKQIPQISATISEKQLNQLAEYINWDIDVVKLKQKSENLFQLIEAIQSGLQISGIQLIVDELKIGKYIYSGELIEHLPYGYGIAKYSDEAFYEGQWVKGAKHGMGTTEAYGESYIGQWFDGEPEDEGEFFWPNGDEYQGAFMDGMQHGQGKFKFHNGDTYSGRWSQDKQNGYGVFKWRQGPFEEDVYFSYQNSYKGLWKDNKMHGFGIYIQANGSKYTGQFVEGKYRGYGTFTLPDGRKYEGEFTDDSFNGKGEFKCPDGAWYIGDFVDNQFSGEGKLFDEDGFLFTGKWEHHLKQGVHILHKLVKVELQTFKDDLVVKRRKL